MRVTVLYRYRAQTIRAFTTRQAHLCSRGAPDTANARRPWRTPSGVPGYARVAGPTIQLLRRDIRSIGAIGKGVGSSFFFFSVTRSSTPCARGNKHTGNHADLPRAETVRESPWSPLTDADFFFFPPPTCTRSRTFARLLRPAERRSRAIAVPELFFVIFN